MFKWFLGAVGILAVMGIITVASLSAWGNLFSSDSEPEAKSPATHGQANLPGDDTVPAGSGPTQGSEIDHNEIEPIFADTGDGSGGCDPEGDLASCDGDMVDGSAAAGGSDQPITSIDDIDPDECNLVHNIEACDSMMVDKVSQDLAQRLGVDVKDIRVVSVERVDWPDSNLGHSDPLALYLPVVTPGYRIMLAASGQLYEYHTDLTTNFVLVNEDGSAGNDANSSDPVEPEMMKQPAPIGGTEIAVAESFPPQYFLHVKYGLPSGCAQPGGYEVDRNGDVITVNVSALLPADPETVCTMIYRVETYNVPLGSDFESGHTYTVLVNGEELTFTAQ